MSSVVRPTAKPGSSRETADAYTPGTPIRARGEEWLVQEASPAGDHWFVTAVGVSGIVRDQVATFYTAIEDVSVSDPAKTKVIVDTSNRHVDAKLWLDATVRRSPVPTQHAGLVHGNDSLVDPLTYQKTAVKKALNPDLLRPRILLSDAVGLGKTIEIGMILSELIARGRGERILVVTPKHVLEQMQYELWTRFSLPFVRLDSQGIQRIRQQLPAGRNPFSFFKRAIISIDTLKSDQYVAHLRNQRWDAVVIDESHNVTNTGTLNNRLANLLARNTEALILASATPHNGRKESFAELVRMLEPSAVSPTGEVDEDLVERLLVRRHRHSPEVAAQVGSQWATREEPKNIAVEASPAENAVAQELQDVWLWPEGNSPAAAALFPWTLAKSFLSSPEALDATITERLRRVAANLEAGDEDEPPSTQNPDRLNTEKAALQRLQQLNAPSLGGNSAKYQRLVQELKDIGVKRGSDMRAVIFSERVPTLKALQKQLTKDLKLPKNAVAILHGGLSDVEQQEVVESFKLASSPIRVLVTGDIASEGVNLHTQCHHLFHFDIPWSLIRIEQRNGRIDRYGQTRKPQITTLLLAPDAEKFRGDFRVLTRLIEREQEAHQALGDAASLIGTYSVKAEEDAIEEVIRGRKDFDEVVRNPNEVAQDDGPTGLFARLAAMSEQDPDESPDDEVLDWEAFGMAAPESATSESASDAASGPASASVAPASPQAQSLASSGLFDNDFNFLDAAIRKVLEAPERAAPHGIDYAVKPEYSHAALTPPPELVARLDALPQTYLREREVKQRLHLATSKEKGKQSLHAAHEGASRIMWPEESYLTPLHPVLDWAADRVLADTPRDAIYAIPGDVPLPSVLLLGSLLNSRGQIIHQLLLVAEFYNPEAPFWKVYNTPREALASLGLPETNKLQDIDPEALQPYVAAAVTSAQEFLETEMVGVRQAAQDRVEAWQQRTSAWEAEADAAVKRASVRAHIDDVEEEQRLLESLAADRSVVRPLLVVVPKEEDQ